ncbi:MAG TPA: TIGR03767 family metallophosphoesterase [Acidimicrobiales bacterium]|nr:TIGR03767 family metallophosphoesterase [Acidimicrobiales bacterium]
MVEISRRGFLGGVGAVAAGGLVAPGLFRSERAAAQALAGLASPRGTTLEATIIPTGNGPYRRLTSGPGRPFVVRTLGVEPKPGREGRREGVASIVHLTDVHVIDAQSPARVEFLDRYGNPFTSAQRPQEVLTAQVAESMVRRINDIGQGPVTGRPFDCAVSTGDNIDNQQANELEWFLTLLDGGPLAPNSGGPAYEGVQDQDPLTFDPHYWHPEDEDPEGDQYKKTYGFPAYPGLLVAAVAPFTATGLTAPWFTVNGNHDGLVQGNAPENSAFEAVATGSVKVVNLPAGISPTDFQRGLVEQDPSVLAALAVAPARPVTPDPKRRFVSSVEFAAAHLHGTHDGHGLTEENVATNTLYYSFEVAPAVTGIVLDTCNRGGYAEGSIDPAQFAWLEQQLRAVSSRYFDSAGVEVRTSAADRLVVVFSHHNLAAMTNVFPDPSTGGQRVTGDAIKALLHRFPNVVLWVNGHSHENRVVPHPDPASRAGGFWEVLTAAHVDYPQQARIVEIVDNRDGTLSLFGVTVEHAAPPTTTVGATDVLSLAAISRELSANDYQVGLATALGTPEDRNVELVIAAPFKLAGSVGPGDGRGRGKSDEVGRATGGELAATGGGLEVGFGLGAAALGAALALRRRRETADDCVS